jgi:hypothetical protein
MSIVPASNIFGHGSPLVDATNIHFRRLYSIGFDQGESISIVQAEKIGKSYWRYKIFYLSL